VILLLIRNTTAFTEEVRATIACDRLVKALIAHLKGKHTIAHIYEQRALKLATTKEFTGYLSGLAIRYRRHGRSQEALGALLILAWILSSIMILECYLK
jgi:hypothetical protein